MVKAVDKGAVDHATSGSSRSPAARAGTGLDDRRVVEGSGRRRLQPRCCRCVRRHHRPADRRRPAGSGFAVDDPVVVPDGEPVGAAIAPAVARGARVVLTTGGTGLTPTDRTPEATRPLLDREVPGIAEAIRAYGVAKGVPTAALSRGLAGVVGDCLVVNLPGLAGRSEGRARGARAHRRTRRGADRGERPLIGWPVRPDRDGVPVVAGQSTRTTRGRLARGALSRNNAVAGDVGRHRSGELVAEADQFSRNSSAGCPRWPGRARPCRSRSRSPANSPAS